MTVEKLKRKLTTIFCADVQSYSALMANDEADTLQRLQRYRAIMSELFARHDGRKVNTWGDAVIAEFSSVVEAVRCGVEIQDAIGAENRDLPQAKQMWFRIGINLGDVMQDGTDLYGDGVNVASRLESLADPGGIMVSETVYDLTHRQLSFAYDFAGEQKVKGQANPIAGYRVRMPGSNTTPETDAAAGRIARREEPMRQRSDARPPTVSPMRHQPTTAASTSCAIGFSPSRSRCANPIAMIALFATINLLTSGFSTIWFIYPSIPFVLFLLFHFLVLTRRTYNANGSGSSLDKMPERSHWTACARWCSTCSGPSSTGAAVWPAMRRRSWRAMARGIRAGRLRRCLARPLCAGNGGDTQRQTAVHAARRAASREPGSGPARFGIDPARCRRAELDEFNLAWHRLDPGRMPLPA